MYDNKSLGDDFMSYSDDASYYFSWLWFAGILLFAVFLFNKDQGYQIVPSGSDRFAILDPRTGETWISEKWDEMTTVLRPVNYLTQDRDPLYVYKPDSTRKK